MLSFVPAGVEGQATFVTTGDHGRDAHASAHASAVVEGQAMFVITERIIQDSEGVIELRARTSGSYYVPCTGPLKYATLSKLVLPGSLQRTCVRTSLQTHLSKEHGSRIYARQSKSLSLPREGGAAGEPWRPPCRRQGFEGDERSSFFVRSYKGRVGLFRRCPNASRIAWLL